VFHVSIWGAWSFVRGGLSRLGVQPAIHTWPMPSLSRRSERRRHENIFAESSYTTQLRVTAQHKNCPSSVIDDRPGRDLFRVLKRSPISQPHALGIRRSCSDVKAVGNMTGLRRRLHPHWRVATVPCYSHAECLVRQALSSNF